MRLLVAYLMVLEIGAPGAGTVNKRLHDSPLGLDGVIQVVGGPFMQWLAQRYCSEFAMLASAVEILGRDALQHSEVGLAQASKFGGQLLWRQGGTQSGGLCGCVPCVSGLTAFTIVSTSVMALCPLISLLSGQQRRAQASSGFASYARRPRP
jgi:hypothetical protein